MKKFVLIAAAAALAVAACSKKNDGQQTPKPEPDTEWQFSIENQTAGTLSILSGDETIAIEENGTKCVLEGCSVEEWNSRNFSMTIDGEPVDSRVFDIEQEHWTQSDEGFHLVVDNWLLERFEVGL